MWTRDQQPKCVSSNVVPSVNVTESTHMLILSMVVDGALGFGSQEYEKPTTSPRLKHEDFNNDKVFLSHERHRNTCGIRVNDRRHFRYRYEVIYFDEACPGARCSSSTMHKQRQQK